MSFASDVSSSIERILELDPGTLRGITEKRALADAGEWLSGRNLGLVPVADAATFAWAGHWLGIVEHADASRSALVMFGSPSGPLEPADDAIFAMGSLVAGYVIAPLNVHLPPHAGAYGETTGSGIVTAIFTAPAKEAPCLAHDRCRVFAKRGLEGDRYAMNSGTFSHPDRSGQDLTLIAAESLAALAESGIELSAAEARRNLVTEGIDLEGLVGQRLMIGSVECFASRLAEPCAHLQRITRSGVLRGLVHRGGIRVDVLTDGEFVVGDQVRPLGP
ncbi:MAG: MOSC domain-containing protein [Thermoleophilia bacterium]